MKTAEKIAEAARVSWTDAGAERTGTIWSLSPRRAAVYVVPDSARDDELVIVLGVGKSNAGRVLETISRRQQAALVREIESFQADPRVVRRTVTRRSRNYYDGTTTVDLVEQYHRPGCDCELPTSWHSSHSDVDVVDVVDSEIRDATFANLLIDFYGISPRPNLGRHPSNFVAACWAVRTLEVAR